MIRIMRTPHSGPEQSQTLFAYSSVLPKITEANIPLCVSIPTEPCLKRSVSG